MTAWCLTLVWLCHDNQYQLFIAPKFGFLIYISMALSLMFVLGIAKVNVLNRIDQSIKGMILVLPVLFIFSAGENTLGSFALSKRIMKPLQTDSIQELGVSPPPSTDAAKEFHLVSISKLVRSWDTYNGKRISVEGLFSESVIDQKNLSAVFRYYISCCAADAMPVGVFIRHQKDTDIKNNDWVRVSGKVYMETMDEYEVIYMDVENIEKREKPSKNAAYIY